ncbi:hypothetical protein ACFE04_010574 [Oxalis oulophora]
MNNLLGARRTNFKSQSKRHGSKKDDCKIVYISNPMKVNTCVSDFRAIVQKLTGKDSDVSLHFKDTSYSSSTIVDNSKNYMLNNVSGHDHQEYPIKVDHHLQLEATCKEESSSSPISDDTLFLEPFNCGDDQLVAQFMDGSFMEMIASNSNNFHSLLY